jgi:hypothetical protein
VIFLNPDDPIIDPKNTLGQFGRDMYQVMTATAVVVDARERRGLGIGVEMAAASAMAAPVIVVAPRNTKYRVDRLEYRGAVVDDYVHPHIYALSSYVAETFEEAGQAVAGIEPPESRRNRVPEWLEPAISEYEQSVLPNDRPMIWALTQLGLTIKT